MIYSVVLAEFVTAGVQWLTEQRPPEDFCVATLISGDFQALRAPIQNPNFMEASYLNDDD